MRFLSSLGVAVLLGFLPVLASAQEYGSSSFPYFRRIDTGVTASFSSVRAVPLPTLAAPPPQPQIGVSLESDRSEGNPGDDVRYWVRVRNMHNENLPAWKIAFFYDANQMRILEKGGGTMRGDRVTFSVPPLGPGEEWNFTVRTQLFKSLQNGDTVLVYASMIWDGTLSPACSKNLLRIFKIEPQTGVELSNGSAEDRRAMPPMAWAGVVLTGVGLGGGVSKKFL